MASQPRLTYVTTAGFPAAKASSVQVMQMCAAFAEAGALVKLVARKAESDIDIFEHYGLRPNFTFVPRRLPRVPRPTDVFQVQAVMAELGSNWICYARGQDLTAPFVALGRGARAMIEAHVPPSTARQRWMLRWIARHPRGRLIAISEPLRDYFERELGLRAHLAPDAVDLKRFEPALSSLQARQQLGLGDGPWVIYVGGLYAGRGLDVLFSAVADLPVNVLIVGGRDEAEVEVWRGAAAQAGAGRVRFEGYQPPTRVPLYLFAADILVMPYNSRVYTGSGEEITRWTSPLKLYEYMAAGRPILASDLPALRTVLTPEQNALLVPPDNAAALRGAIQRLLEDREFAGRLSANARASAAAHTWVARARAILGLVSSES